jgi:hypothetical protein
MFLTSLSAPASARLFVSPLTPLPPSLLPSLSLGLSSLSHRFRFSEDVKTGEKVGFSLV